jgi:peptidoglycan hydrolase-like protein with peptidoglycan-binding domain
MKAIRLILIALGILFTLAPVVTLAYSPSGNLELWSAGADVQALQQFLNGQNDSVAQTGPGSPSNETTTFGLRTYQALIEFQQMHGLPATGFFGPLTRALAGSLSPSAENQFAASSSSNPTLSGSTTPAENGATSTVMAASSTLPVCNLPPGSTLTCYPGSNIIQPWAPGNGWTPGFGQGGAAPAPAPPPAPAPYVAKAVHFDGNTWLSINSLTSTDNPYFSFSVWVHDIDDTDGPVVFVADPAGSYRTWLGYTASATYVAAGVGNSTGPYLNSSNVTIPATGWHHIIGSAQTNLPAIDPA